MANYTQKQVFHENLMKDEVIEKIENLLQEYKQLQLAAPTINVTVLVSKKGSMTIKKKMIKDVGQKPKELSHNRKKQYLIEAGEMAPFLVDLGVITKQGEIVRTKYDKFK